MGGGREEIHDEIFFLDPHTDLAFSSSSLSTIERHGISFDVSGMRDRDDHFFCLNAYSEVPVRM